MPDRYNTGEWEAGEDERRFRDEERPRETGPGGRYGQGRSYSRFGLQGWEREQTPGQYSRPAEWPQATPQSEWQRYPADYGDPRRPAGGNAGGAYGIEYPESGYRSPGGYGEMFSGDMRQYTGQSQAGMYGGGQRGREVGPYAGRGPKGYQRSDERIKDDVCESLTRHPEVDAEDIEIKVSKGEVTLSGTVMDRYQKRLAEDAIEGVAGVRDIHNQLRAGLGDGQRAQPVASGRSAAARPAQPTALRGTAGNARQGGSSAGKGVSRSASPARMGGTTTPAPDPFRASPSP